MKHTLTLLLLLGTCHAYAAGLDHSDEECAQIYVSVNDAGGKLNAQEANKFLNAISCSYFSTAEGGEFGSELIIVVLENSPSEFVLSFDKLNTSLQEVIIGEIKEPIHDGFDLRKIYSNVANVKTKSSNKSKILSAINQAAKAQGIEIK